MYTDHVSEVVQELRQRMMLMPLCHVLRSPSMSVLDAARETGVWEVNQPSGELLEAVASTQMQQSRTVVRCRLRYTTVSSIMGSCLQLGGHLAPAHIHSGDPS